MAPRCVNVFFAGLFSVAMVALVGCGGGNNGGGAVQADTSKTEGEKLARVYCASCHQFTPPEDLDEYTWLNGVLPIMATYMGIYELNGIELPSEKKDPNVPPGIYPDKPTISLGDFNKIVKYYQTHAPQTPKPQVRSVAPSAQTTRFRVKSASNEGHLPITSLVKIDAERHVIYAADGEKSTVQVYNRDLKKTGSVKLPGPPSWLEIVAGGKALINTMGFLQPSNKKEGVLVSADISSTGALSGLRNILSKLPRPVQSLQADFNSDGKQDILVNGFGHLAGQLYWLENGDAAKKHVLREAPGAIKSYVTDWNKDGLPDVVTLFCQAKESIYLFINKGKGEFESRELLSFPPVYGSSSFELKDMNGDGKTDILYTSGDNADYSIVLKNFHGVYIYLNQSDDRFTQAWFYPVNGCYKAMARDFDLDGDQDIISISYFADYRNQPAEALIYFENNGNLNFTPFTVEGFEKGRWIAMDAADLDGDGDEDVVAGNLSWGPSGGTVEQSMTDFWSKQGPFILLENTTR